MVNVSDSSDDDQAINNSLNQINVERLGERAELQALNNRHANLANRQRELLKQKNELQEQLRITEETCEQRVRECQASCEQRINQMQQKLDALKLKLAQAESSGQLAERKQ